MPFDPVTRPLTPSEARVLATLMEKARTVPDSYPMSLNGLVTGCNQKTSRDPVMNLSDAEAQEALDSLKLLTLAFESSGNRTTRWEHNFQRGVGVPEQSAVLLGLLMLRGPQTAGELRINAERWYRFADISSVEAFLDELQERSAEKGGPLVVQLPRAPGSGGGGSTGTSAALQARVDALETEVANLRTTVQRLCSELGISPDSAPMSPPGQD
jgi:uncharacterized protein YceH (UPF0502 family)